MKSTLRLLGRDLSLMLYAFLATSQVISVLESRYRYPSGDFECLFLIGVIIISFPGNLILLLGGICCHQLCPECEYFNDASVMLLLSAIGYVQLFWLVPKFFTVQTMTTLDLNADEKHVTAGEGIAPPDVPRSLPHTPQPLIPHFGADGLTPLESAIREIPPEH